MLGKSSIEIYSVSMKVKNEEHAEMKASLEDSETFIAIDDDEPPTRKSTHNEMETSK